LKFSFAVMLVDEARQTVEGTPVEPLNPAPGT
jgi:hypothetical protein